MYLFCSQLITDVLLAARVALTEDELSRINQVYENNQDNLEQETSSVYHDQHDQSTLMHEEIASIFEGHPDAADPQRWYVEKSLTKRKARCCAPTCNATLFPRVKLPYFARVCTYHQIVISLRSVRFTILCWVRVYIKSQ